MRLKVLLTGFGPFPGAPFNPSAALARQLARRRRPAFAELTRVAHVFATRYASVDGDLPALLAHRPDIVLMFGLAARTRHVRIETRARNAVSILLPDAGGRFTKAGIITRGKPPALSGNSPARALLHAARSARVPARLSRDAGRYLCNYAYWRALEQSADGKPLVQFVHIPLVRRGPERRTRGRRRGPSLDDLVRAGEAILIALAAAARR
jgi:pyroglutamyl-peptidase